MDITSLEIIGKQLVLKNSSGLIVGFCPLARVCAYATQMEILTKSATNT